MFKLLKINFVILLLISFNALPYSAGCKTNKYFVTLLPHNDFGSPSVSFELLNQSWWSWEPSGTSDPHQRYLICVDVYRGVSLETVKLKYPIQSDKQIDHRYVSSKGVLTYLERNINENMLLLVTQKLRKIIRKILTKTSQKQLLEVDAKLVSYQLISNSSELTVRST